MQIASSGKARKQGGSSKTFVQESSSKRARRVDDDLGENEFHSSDLESLVDERLVSDDDEEEIITLKVKIVGDEDLQPYPEFNILPTVRNEDVDGAGEDDGNESDYLDSSDAGSYESDSDGEILFKKSSKVFFDASSAEPRFEVGMIFESPKQFKEALYAYAVAQRFDFKFLKNEKERTRAKCKARGCPFRIYAFFDKGDGSLRDANPSSSFELKVERPTPYVIPRFRRLYVCFSTLKEAFRTYCRPVLSLDGCFLKGDFKGELLSVVGRAANNQIFPIAWAVVEVENRETWAWFLENLIIDLHLIDGEKFTVISDMQKVST
ncbi:hypothetical protein GQ457_07G006750 [Hibiscus cannabinus]